MNESDQGEPLSPPEFDGYIGIDWSGAAQNYDGIAVAACANGEGAPKLVRPPSRRWTRTTLAEWLEGQLRRRIRLLIGFDFSFGFPFESDLGYLAGRAGGIDNIFALWSLIESKCQDETDFGCLRFISDPFCADLFWRSGTQPSDWVDRRRLAELVCAEATATRPDSLFKLLHSKQVGKASITGMHLLHHLRFRRVAPVAIWPFEVVRASAIVEIYPTLFRKLATGSIRKIRSRSALNEALRRLHSRVPANGVGEDLSDHDSDALLSAVGLRWLAREPGLWSFPSLQEKAVQREGWIFGVGNC